MNNKNNNHHNSNNKNNNNNFKNKLPLVENNNYYDKNQINNINIYKINKKRNDELKKKEMEEKKQKENELLMKDMERKKQNELKKKQIELKKKEIELKKKEMEKKELEKIKKENELQEQIRDSLKCYICLSKVTKPKMCNFCKKICCEVCINKWLENKSYCGMCKHPITAQDMITLPFLDDMSQFFINNIDNKEHKSKKNQINNDLDLITEVNENSLILDNNENNDVCPLHKYKFEYYCIQCTNYYCSQCFIFFNKEANKHENHIVVPISKMDNLRINEAINEYEKLTVTKNKINDLIGLCNLKEREKQIKKFEIINYFDALKKLFIQKMDEESSEFKALLDDSIQQKINIETKINVIPSQIFKFSELNNNDDNHNKIELKKKLFDDLKEVNDIEPALEQKIIQKSKESPKLFVENYDTDFMEFSIPQELHEGDEFINCPITIIHDFPCKLVFKYLNHEIYISFIVNVSAQINNYPNFDVCIIIKNKNFGLEFINFNIKKFPQNESKEIIICDNLDLEKFLYLCSDDKKLILKAYIVKTFYK